MTSEERYTRYRRTWLSNPVSTELDIELQLDLASLAEEYGELRLAQLRTRLADLIWVRLHGGQLLPD